MIPETAMRYRRRQLDMSDSASGIERRYGRAVQWGFALASTAALLVVWGLPSSFAWPWGAELSTVVAYLAATVVLTIAVAPPWSDRAPSSPSGQLFRRGPLLLTQDVLDHLYVTALIVYTGGYRSELYLLYGLLAIRAALYHPFAENLVYVSFASGLLWIAANVVSATGLFFLADPGFILRYLALFAFVVGCAGLGWLIERRQRSISRLGANLSEKGEALADESAVVQLTANDLANRLLELRSLQESVKAINSELEFDELIQVIVENATQVLRGARCSLSVVDESREYVSTSAVAGIEQRTLRRVSLPIGQGAAGWVVQNRQSLLIDDVSKDSRFVHVEEWPVASLLSVPLVSEGRVIGALTATSEQPHDFSDADVNLLDAYGDQAAIAVKNARLYEQLLREEQQTAHLYQSVLEKSDELEAVLTGIGDAVIVVDPKLRLQMMNPVAAKIFGIVAVPEPGVRLPDIVDQPELVALAQETLSGQDAPQIQEIVLADEGDRTKIYQAMASAIMAASGHVRGAVMVMRDVTQQREIEQMKSDFLSVVSHELRTPLHSIKGFVDIILMGKTGEINDLQRDFLTTVKESSTNLQRLIDDLLEFSRMEAGQIKLRAADVSLWGLVDRVAEQLSPLAQQGNLGLVNAVEESIDLIEADPMRIEQVLTNLMTNAIKFTPAGGTVTVSARDIGDEIEVSVRDTGIGIAEDELPRVFERFYQVDSSASRSYRGAGLGLTICEFIVEYHHGSIRAESTLGEGSTFLFTLPKKLPTDEALVIDFTRPARRG